MVSFKYSLLIVGIALGGAALLFSQSVDQPTSSNDLRAENPGQTYTQGQMPVSRKAYIDPETGELTSTPPAGSDLPVSSYIQSNLPPVEFMTYSDGSMQANLNGRFQSTLKATIGCDGNIQVEHSEGRDLPTATPCKEVK